MFNSLYGKLVGALLLLFCVVGLLVMAVMKVSFDRYQAAVTQELNRGLAKELATEPGGAQSGLDAIRKQFDKVMTTHPATEIYLLDADGSIRAYSAPQGKVLRTSVNLDPVERFLDERGDYPIYGDDPRHPERKKIFSVAPLRNEAEVVGYFYVILGGEQYDTVAQTLKSRFFMWQSGWIVIAGLVCALVAGLIIFAVVTAKLRRLSSAMDVFRRSDFGEKILFMPDTAESRDEIDRLGATYNEMVERIARQMRALQEIDAGRRDMIANVSHDLRTPLAALRGYLDTLLLKEDSLTPEERRTYLEIAARQSEHLGNLVSQLFELAKLDFKDVAVNLEPMQLSELAQDVIQKFRPEAERKQVKLKIEAAPSVPYVRADIAMIERVLENLIGNALRHSPPNGIVTLSVTPGKERVRVEVADTGTGIPEDKLPFIFERFYRADASRSTASGGAGLGLAISKRIVELHGSEIQVESKLNAGARFSFALPVSGV
jgi:two-component system OmpR family sensor kinase